MQGLTSIELVKAKVQNELPHIYFTGLKVKKILFLNKNARRSNLLFHINSKINLVSYIYDT